jgi:hypothetical protein
VFEPDGRIAQKRSAISRQLSAELLAGRGFNVESRSRDGGGRELNADR